MNNFKKNIYRTSSDTVAPTTPYFGIQTEINELCYGAASIRVNTTIPVKVNMTGTFQATAIYHTEVGYRDADIVDEVISGMTIYRFGIDASNGGALSFNSDIVFTINDFTTGTVIQTYTLNRNHAVDLC